MKSIELNDHSVFYQIFGNLEGPVLVLIGGVTSGIGMWGPHIEAWESKYKIVVIDPAGGASGSTAPKDCTMEFMAVQVAALLEELEIDSANIVGCSMGGGVALALGLNHREKVKSLALMCVWGLCTPEMKEIFAGMDQAYPDGADVEGRRAFYRETVFDLIFSERHRNANPDDLDAAIDGLANDKNPQPKNQLSAQIHACTAVDLLPRLPELQGVPTLVLYGDDDRFVPASESRKVAEGIPGATKVGFTACEHAVHYEALVDFNGTIEKFVDTGAI